MKILVTQKKMLRDEKENFLSFQSREEPRPFCEAEGQEVGQESSSRCRMYGYRLPHKSKVYGVTNV